MTTTTLDSIQLSWNPLTPLTNVSYYYEVAYDVQCSDTNSFSPSYVMPNTTDTSVIVSGLMSGNCYTLGVRAHPSVDSVTSVFSVTIGTTLSDG